MRISLRSNNITIRQTPREKCTTRFEIPRESHSNWVLQTGLCGLGISGEVKASFRRVVPKTKHPKTNKLEAKSQELEAKMRKPIKYVEKAAVAAAKGAWVIFDRLNRINPGVSPTPKWSDKPLLKSYEKSKPPLGWPRSTDSLCPKCVPEIRQQILDGKLPHEVLMNEKIGEIKATII